MVEYRDTDHDNNHRRYRFGYVGLCYSDGAHQRLKRRSTS